MNRIVSDVGLHNAVAGAMAMIPALAVSSVFAGAASAAAEAPADAVLRDAYVYTVDAHLSKRVNFEQACDQGHWAWRVLLFTLSLRFMSPDEERGDNE
jgi:hypothetical protein